MPYYKWSFRLLREIEGEAGYSDKLSFLLCGDKGGIDTVGDNDVTVNYVKNGRQVVEIPDMNAGGVAFYDGKSSDATDLDMYDWFKAIKGEGEVFVKPEQALVVTRILEAIYTSAKTGKPVYIND